MTVGLAIGAALAIGLLGASLSPLVHPWLGSFAAPASPLRLCTEIAAYTAVALVIFRRLPVLARRSRRELGLCRPSPPALLVAFGTAIVLICFQAAALAPYLALVHATGHVQAGFEDFAPHGWAAYLLVSIAALVAAPIAEELLFRGVIFNWLTVRVGTASAAVGSGTMFGLSHGDLVLLPFLVFDGIAFALVYRYTRNLYATMIVHGLRNVIVVLGSSFFANTR